MTRSCRSVTVLVATRNRVEMLRRCLRGLSGQALPPGVEVEALVVDNGSSDGTAGLLEELAAGYAFPFRSLHEPEAGRSRALNAGLRAATGELIFLLDDDATPRPGWLVATWEAFATRDADLVGGRLLPPAAFSPPAWYDPERMSGMLALLDWGDEPFELDERLPYGANLAFRRDTALRLGGFDLRLGRTATSLLAGEDHEFCRRVLLAGGRGLYWPDSACEHDVAASRLRRGYFRSWKWGAGRSGYHLMYPRAARRLLGAPRFLLGGVARAGVRWLGALLRGDGERAYLDELQLRSLAGSLYEAWWGRRETGDVPLLLERAPETVSVVIPALDAEETIEAAIRSVLEGERLPDEILVVDDGCQDATAARALACGSRVRVLPSEGRGPSAARNTGIRHATGDWIAFLDADDLWEPNRLRTQLEAVAPYPEVALVSSRIRLFDESGRSWELSHDVPPDRVPGFHLERLLRQNYVFTLTVLARRPALLESGGFDEGRDRSEDFELWTRLHRRHPTLFVDALSARRRVREDSLSSDYEAMFRAHEEIVEQRMEEMAWSERRRRATRAGLLRWICFHRAWLRLRDGHTRAARQDLLAYLRRRPLHLRALWLLLLTFLPHATRHRARGVARRLRGKEDGA